MHEITPFAIPAMRDFVPEKWRPWIVYSFCYCLSIFRRRFIWLRLVNGRFDSFDAGGYYDGRIRFFGRDVVDICHYVSAEVSFPFENSFPDM